MGTCVGIIKDCCGEITDCCGTVAMGMFEVVWYVICGWAVIFGYIKQNTFRNMPEVCILSVQFKMMNRVA